jgi:protein SDA1
MLFAMVERGMDAEVQGDKGKVRAIPGTASVQKPANAVEGLWAVVLTKELWRKGVW